VLGQIGVFMPDHAVIDKLVPFTSRAIQITEQCGSRCRYGARRLFWSITPLFRDLGKR